MYVGKSSIVYGKTMQKYRMLNAWAELRSANMRVLKKQFWDLKQSAD